MTVLYRQLADHYREAIARGTLAVGDRMPSVRSLMRTHRVSLSTALQACRHLEDGGWLEARPRSGYFVRRPRRQQLLPSTEPVAASPQHSQAHWVGIHAKVSAILMRSEHVPVRADLAIAVCTPDAYPAAELNRATARALRQFPAMQTTMSRRHGHPDLQAALSRRVLTLGVQAAPEQVVVTHGCTEAINLALRAVARPGDTVAVESPTFYGLLQILESLGLKALELPTSPRTGLSVEALAFALQHHSVKAVLCMPNLQNPLGSVMPDDHKQQLVALCEAQGVALIEDDIYAAMSASDTPLKPLKAWDRTGNVIYCNSLNKSLAPGLRLGWMLAGRWQPRVEMLKYTQSRFTESLPQLAAADFVASGAFDRHLQRLRTRLTRQREQMAEAVAQHFPIGTRLSLPDGGLLLWVELPEGVSSERVFDEALLEGVRISPGAMYSNSGHHDRYLRLSCGGRWDETTQWAVRTLGRIVERAGAGPSHTGLA